MSTTMTDPITDILSRLQNVRKSGNQWQGKCPAHEDNRASLSITTGADGRALLKCHAGCSIKDICGALGIVEADLFTERHPAGNGKAPKPRIVKTYPYHDAEGTLLYEVVALRPQRLPAAQTRRQWRLDLEHAGHTARALQVARTDRVRPFFRFFRLFRGRGTRRRYSAPPGWWHHATSAGLESGDQNTCNTCRITAL